MQELFITTRDLLFEMANATGLSYKEINVLVWYFVIPFSWAVLFDVIVGKHRGTLVVGLISLVIGALLHFSGSTEWLFDRSCEFLVGSEVGGSYVNASVIICLFVPLAIYAIMVPWAGIATWKRRGKTVVTTENSG
ncbi:MAG: hypothetical protein AAFN77_24325 [Planctomycetota bacterium]